MTIDELRAEALRRTRADLPWWVWRRRVLVRNFTRDVKAPYNRGGTVLFGERELHVKACHAPAGALVIDAWGKLKLCANDYYGREDWGDTTTTRIRDLWALPAYRDTRRALLRGEFEKEICRTCVGRVQATHPLADHRP